MATTALQEKEKGNAAYKAKKFDEAIRCYDAAISLDPTDITFYNNKGAVHYEKGEYDKVIEVCNKGAEVGKEHNAEYKHVGKSFARIAKAYLKKGDLDESMKFYDKAITEHRSPDILNERNQVQKQIKEREARGYINPEKSKEEKSKGNEFFKQGKFAEAIPFYTEAIKRNPEDHIPYSNRAACYTKLMEFGLAMQDCNKCIELNPGFIKGYLRKGAVLKMDKPQEAIAVYKKALEIDPNNHEAQEGIRSCRSALNQLPPEERAKRAMSDPEIQSILQDPAMQVILEQMNKDSAAAHEHLKNPVIMQKFSKLVESGIVKLA